MLAYHFTRSDNAEKAVAYLVKSNHKATNLNAMGDAKSYFAEAMRILDILPETEANQGIRISLLASQWTVFSSLLKYREYYELLTRYECLAQELENNELRGVFDATLALCENMFGHFDRAVRRGTKAAELCETARNAEYAGISYYACLFGYLFKGDFESVFALLKDVLRQMEFAFNPRIYVRAMSGSAMAHTFKGSWNEAVAQGENAMHVAETSANESLVSYSALVLAVTYGMKGEMKRALEYGMMTVEKAPTIMDKPGLKRYLLASGTDLENHSGG